MNSLDEVKILKNKISVLNELGQAFSSYNDIDELSHLVLSKTMELTNSDAGSIYLIEKEKDIEVLVFKCALNNSVKTDILGAKILINEDTASGYVASTGRTVIINDTSKPYNFTVKQKMGDYTSKNMMIVPMYNIRSEIVGVVQLINKYIDSSIVDYEEDDIQLLLSIASQLAVTIDRIQTNIKLERNVALTRTTLISFFNGMKQTMSTIGEDIMEEQEKFKRYATYDSLTGLLTRKEGVSFLEKQLELARFNGTSVVICFLDVNDLKYVNDNFGHHEGDRMLSLFAKVVQHTARENDLIFRYGGDEFILVLNNITKNVAHHVWNRIKDKLRAIRTEHDLPFDINVAIGYSEYDYKINQTASELIKKADEEMYINKQKMKA